MDNDDRIRKLEDSVIRMSQDLEHARNSMVLVSKMLRIRNAEADALKMIVVSALRAARSDSGTVARLASEIKHEVEASRSAHLFTEAPDDLLELPYRTLDGLLPAEIRALL